MSYFVHTDHDHLPQDILTLVYCTNDVMLIRQSEEAVNNYSNLICNTFVCLRVGNKSSKKLTAFHFTEILGVQWCGTGQDIFLNKD